MAFVHSFFFLLLLLSVCTILSADVSKDHPKCSSFTCGKLGELSFPFYGNNTNSYCGYCEVNCSSEPLQKIRLVDGGRWFEVQDLSQSNSLLLTDPSIKKQLTSSSCDVFTSLNLSNSGPLISYMIRDNQTLFKCKSSLNISIPENVLRHKCGHYDMYYGLINSTINSSPFESQCSVIQLPVDKSSRGSNIFSFLTATFFLDMFVPRDCFECHYNGGRCEATDNRNHKCNNEKEGNEGTNISKEGNEADKNLRLKLGLGIGGSLILLIIIPSLFMLRHCYRKKHASPRYIPRNISSRSDLEGGSVYYKVPIFSYSELEKITGNFDSDKLLGDGGFGTVYYGELPDGREVAVKRLYEHNFRRVEQFMNEIEILTKLQHKNLVALYGCTSRRSHELLLVYEFVPNGTVADNLYGDTVKAGSLTWPIRMSIAIETASALAYLHASGIIHRDVKTNNILLDNNFSVKVADFGLSRLFPLDVTHVSTAPQGTPGYVDPEYHQCYQLTNKSDVYSFGVVLTELISSMPAVDINRHRHEINLANLAINRIQKCAFNELIDPSLGYESDQEVRRMTTSVAELAFRCLQQDKEMRPTMDEVWEELKRIQTGEYKLENPEERQENEVMKNVRPSQSSPEYAEAALLKNNRVPPSPISVTHKWVSVDTTPDTSAYSQNSA